jgi:signal transduction histidine kinase
VAITLNSISSRMLLALLTIHAILLPALFYGVLTIVKNGQQDAFVDHARNSAIIIADILEANHPLGSEQEIIRQLDSAVLGGRSTYAVMRADDRVYISSLMDDADADLFVEDFAFGMHGDDVYYLSVPFELENSIATLQLGFDEGPTLLQIDGVRKTLVNILLLYFFVSLFLVALLSALLAKPLQRLRRDSREIASGGYTRNLPVTSRIHEIAELTRDLETMRSNLVGANERLIEEIEEREAAEAKQESLEARLRHAQRLESIGTLAGGIAHEFNNVLLPLLLYTELAIEDLPEDSTARDELDKVLKLGNRAKNLSQQILTFGRQAGDAEKVALDIAPVVEEALSLVRALIPATIEIRTDIKHNLGTLLCDATQIQQLVVNLCSNAYRSLSVGGGYINVSVDEQDVSTEFAEMHARLRVGKYVCLAVSDTGVGMDAATLDRIFEPFFTTREVGAGSGLGLSVVHGIVLKHDGEIVVWSKPGEGSIFRVFLPLAGQQVSADSDNDE